MNGIYQGHSLAVILFILSLNLLSHLYKHAKGYAYGENIQYTQNFVVDDLKLYSTNINDIKH